MNHLSRLFGHTNKMNSKQKRRKPKLDRRNAVKNIDYEASASFSSTDESSPLRTRSLDIPPYSDRTSFRIGGTEGEIDRICWSLGLSGPEDFAISEAAWEARKARSSSDLLPRSRLNQPYSPNDSDQVDDGLFIRSGDRVFDQSVIENDNLAELSNSRNLVAVESTRGIKGIRTPVLAPPPSISIPVLQNIGSTWDIIRGLAPEDDNIGSASKLRVDTSSSDEEEEEVSVSSEEPEDEVEVEEIGREIVEREETHGLRLGETVVLSESCSCFSTSNDDDSSSSNTDTTYIISPNGRFRREIKSWTKGSLLGSGSFGTVYEGLSDDGFFFAVKEVSLLDQGSQGQQSIHQLEQEIALLSQFEHENIVRYLGTDKDDAKLYIFLELVTKGSLAHLYQKYHLRDPLVSAYTRQILHGLNYLHGQNVVHRDIKCANILVDANGSVKLADFGLAKATKLNDVKSCKGTAFWMAPEVVNRKSHGYGLAADIWSLGCTVLEMLTRRLPYTPLECMQALYRIGRGIPPPVPNTLSSDARDFIHQCLQVNPNDRPSASELLDHPFVKRPLPISSASGSPILHSDGRRS